MARQSALAAPRLGTGTVARGCAVPDAADDGGFSPTVNAVFQLFPALPPEVVQDVFPIVVPEAPTLALLSAISSSRPALPEDVMACRWVSEPGTVKLYPFGGPTPRSWTCQSPAATVVALGVVSAPVPALLNDELPAWQSGTPVLLAPV